MKKTLLLLSFVFALAANMFAVPALPGQWKTITLADGTQVRAELRGDEYCHYWVSAEGDAYMEGETSGIFTPVKWEMISQRAEAARVAMGNRAPVLIDSATPNSIHRIHHGEPHDPYVGTKKNLCILVEFSDVKFKAAHTLDMYKQYINGFNFKHPELGDVQTVREYFKDQSNGQFEMDIDVVGPYVMNGTQAYYGANAGGGDQVARIHEMIKAAINNARNEGIDFSQYDWDNDGNCEAVFVLYAGMGEATGGSSNTIWPHKGQLSQPIIANGKKVADYACSSELSFNETASGTGVMCHEYSHCLGLPDLYDVSLNYAGAVKEKTLMGDWDIMDSGNYLPDMKATHPIGYSAYERWYSGWLTPIELSTEEVEVKNLKPLSRGGDAYIIYNKKTPTEYYLIENRNQEGTDLGIHNSGLLIYHVDFSAVAWSNNCVNAPKLYPYINNRYRYTIVSSSGQNDENAVYPLVSKALTYDSDPQPTLNNVNVDNTKLLDISIYDVKKHEDGTVSFKYKPGKIAYPEKPQGALFYESFSHCYGYGANDGDLFNKETTSTANEDNEGWKYASDASYAANSCVLIGKSGISRPAATTPSFAISGTCNLSFKVASFGSETTRIQVSVTDGTVEGKASKTISSISAGKWLDVKTTIEGEGNVSVKFTSLGKRFYIDEVLVSPIESGIVAVDADKVAAKNIVYNLNGQRVNAKTKGIVIVNGRKVVK